MNTITYQLTIIQCNENTYIVFIIITHLLATNFQSLNRK